jgi:hypothetical protein
LNKIFVSFDEIVGQHDVSGINRDVMKNLYTLGIIINRLREYVNRPFVLTSGYRPAEHNKKIGGAPNSAHVTGQAVDIADKDGSLGQYFIQNPQVLNLFDIYIESPTMTPNWVHVSIKPTNSGIRIFNP